MRINLLAPIGNLGSVEGWKLLPLDECGESLVPLGAFSNYRQIATDAIYAGERISSPYSWRALEGSLITVFVREGVAKRLAQAAALLPPAHLLFVWDAYRPLTVQRALFDYFVNVLEGQGMDHEQAIEEAQRFVSIPSSDQTRPSPHNTGAAVDLTIIRFTTEGWVRMQALDVVAGQLETEQNWREIYTTEMERQQLIREAATPLMMGTVFDGVAVETATRFYEDLGDDITAERRRCRDNRRMLWNAMTAAGFSNYPEEWWHYQYGNQMDTAPTGRPAVYGAATFSDENARWEEMRHGHYMGSIAISDGRHPGGSGKLLHQLYPFVCDVAHRTGDLRHTIHPVAAAL